MYWPNAIHLLYIQHLTFHHQNPSGSGHKGQEYCPQIVGVSEEVLIPVGFERSYTLLAKNLPTRGSPVRYRVSYRGVYIYLKILRILSKLTNSIPNTIEEDKKYISPINAMFHKAFIKP